MPNNIDSLVCCVWWFKETDAFGEGGEEGVRAESNYCATPPHLPPPPPHRHQIAPIVNVSAFQAG